MKTCSSDVRQQQRATSLPEHLVPYDEEKKGGKDVAGERNHDYTHACVGSSKQKVRTKSPLNRHKLKPGSEKTARIFYYKLEEDELLKTASRQ